jgi:phosphoribosylformimino-5-aminoimidazole carboxamide ribotide isomerase
MLKRDERGRGSGSGGEGGVEVIPAVDLLGGRVVRLRRGDYARVTEFSDDPVDVAARLAEGGARRLHVIDLDAARSGERPAIHAAAIAAIARLARVRLQVGGGVRALGDVEALVELGADRVLVGSLAAAEPEAVGALAAATGRVVVAIDVRDGRVRTHGWERDSGVAAEALTDRLAAAGVRDFLVTAIDRDGTGTGPDTALLRRLRPRVPGELIAAGGIAEPAHLAAAAAAGADAAVVGRALLEGALSLPR